MLYIAGKDRKGKGEERKEKKRKAGKGGKRRAAKGREGQGREEESSFPSQNRLIFKCSASLSRVRLGGKRSMLGSSEFSVHLWICLSVVEGES